MRRLGWSIVSGLLLSLVCTSAASAKKLVIFAPHPDDEALMASGIMYSALARGDTVTVVVMTNGDSGGPTPGTTLGITREGETVTGMSTLGLGEQNIIFLGYGDGTLLNVYKSSSPTTIFPSGIGQTQTYGSRGLGGTDYHNFLNGVHGAYNQVTLLADVTAVLQNFNPDEIYTTGSWDAHPDHQGTLLFVAQAILALKKSSGFSPILYETIIHAPGDGYTDLGPNAWPAPVFTPLTPMSIPHGLASTPLDWNQIINFPVPAAMQDPNAATNLKEQVISAYQSQLPPTHTTWLFSFVKKNEFFWVSNYLTNQALNATITDSSEASGQPGTAAIDGVVDGYPGNFPQEWATRGQLAGAWIQLNWAQPITASLIVLHDRPNTTDNVRAGTLTFNDGSSISVGTLPDNGDGLAVALSRKSITSVRFTVNQAVGLNIGLCEIEVYGTPGGSNTNYAPQILSGPVASPNVVNASDTSSNLSFSALDLNGDTLQYSWSADSGSIVGNGPTAVFTPPAFGTTTASTITVTVNDGKGGTAINSTFVSANAPGTVTFNPEAVLGGVSSLATITLLGPAPPSGAVVGLSSSNTSVATVPSSVTVPGNSTSATFIVTTTSVTAATPVTISASYAGQTKTVIFTVYPITPVVSLNPTSVFGGNPLKEL